MRYHLGFTFLNATIVLIAAVVPSARAGDPDERRAVQALMPALPLSATLSPDGRWFACTMRPGPGPGRLLVCDTDGLTRREIAGATEPVFAGDSKSVVYTTASPAGFEYAVRDLETWTVKRSFRHAARASVTPDARHLVIEGASSVANTAAERRSHDADGVLVYSLIDDRLIAIGPASFCEVSGDGQLIALAKAGVEGRVLLDVLRVGETEARRLYDSRGEVSSLAWGDDNRSLAMVVAQEKADGAASEELVAIDDATAKTPRVDRIRPEEHAAWPKGAYLDLSAPRVGNAGAIVYFVVRAQPLAGPRRTRDDEVEIHRATDGILYDAMTDSLKEGVAQASAWLFAWIPADGRILKVADLDQATVTLLHGGRKALVRKDNPESPFSVFPLTEWDVVDPKSGTRTSLGQRAVTGVSPSRTGRYVAYFDRGHWWAYDTASGARRDVTAGPGPNFTDDLAMGRDAGWPITGVEWLADDGGLVAHDTHDAWLLSLNGTVARRLTRGRERGRVYRLAVGRSRNVAPGGPFDFQVVETRSKNSGYVRVGADGEEINIVFGPWSFDMFARARDAERYVFRRESHDTPPNFFTATAGGGESRPMTDINAKGDLGRRPRRELIQYRDRRGTELQGTLVYPVDHDVTKRYPMVVVIYSIRSDRHFRYYPVPGLFDDPETFASRGYFVLQPDIVFQPREVGPAATDCVQSAVRAVLLLNVVDPSKIGLVGLSLGGYETAFVLSKSTLFAAGVAASPPVDWAGHVLSGRMGSVHPQNAWLRSVGMTVPFWEDHESYVANSLIYQAHDIKTPLLIGVGKRDPVVDYHDGESIFNLLRYLKRPAYLVAYPNGGHGLNDDFKHRAVQFFDHILKNEPAPYWLAGPGRP
jgi:dipeptidyl aminopeptidase/acylaminoacyl peptidase